MTPLADSINATVFSPCRKIHPMDDGTMLIHVSLEHFVGSPARLLLLPGTSCFETLSDFTSRQMFLFRRNLELARVYSRNQFTAAIITALLRRKLTIHLHRRTEVALPPRKKPTARARKPAQIYSRIITCRNEETSLLRV